MTTKNGDDAMPATIKLDRALRKFLRECMSCQSPAIAAWATRILKARQMTADDLKRCFVLGFEA